MCIADDAVKQASSPIWPGQAAISPEWLRWLWSWPQSGWSFSMKPCRHATGRPLARPRADLALPWSIRGKSGEKSISVLEVVRILHGDELVERDTGLVPCRCAHRTHQFGLAVAHGIKILPRVPSNFLSFSAREPALLRQLSNRTCWPRGRRRSGGHCAKKKAVHMGVCCRRMRRPVASGESNSRTPRKQVGQPEEPSHRKGLWTNFSNFEPKAGARRRCCPRHSDRGHPPFSPRALHNPATLTGEFHGEAVFSWHV